MAQVSIRIFVSLAIAIALAAVALGLLLRPQAVQRWMTTGSRAHSIVLRNYFDRPGYTARMRSLGLIAAVCAAILIYNLLSLLSQL
ncbi:MAG: hypothetical protein ACREQ4_01680, partial [Candidatus Binataceae bacterium]